MWSQRINITDLRKIDVAVRSIINDVYTKHKNQMNSILYLPRNYGGRGLLSVEIMYKETKLKSLAKIVTSRDPRIRLVREFENEQYNKGICSIFKDAIKFANDMGVTVLITDQTHFVCNTRMLGIRPKKLAMLNV